MRLCFFANHETSQWKTSLACQNHNRRRDGVRTDRQPTDSIGHNRKPVAGNPVEDACRDQVGALRMQGDLAAVQIERRLFSAGQRELSELQRVLAHQGFQEVFIVLQGLLVLLRNLSDGSSLAILRRAYQKHRWHPAVIG